MNPPNHRQKNHATLLKNDLLELQAIPNHQFLIALRSNSFDPFARNQPGESPFALGIHHNPIAAFFNLNSVLNLKHPKRKRWLFLGVTGRPDQNVIGNIDSQPSRSQAGRKAKVK